MIFHDRSRNTHRQARAYVGMLYSLRQRCAGGGRDMNFTAIANRPPPRMAPATPLVLVVEAAPEISDMLAELGTFLCIRVTRVPTGASLARALLMERPICVLARAPAAGRDVCDALAAIAHHDPALPVLLVSGNSLPSDTQDDPPLSNLYWVGARPGLRMLVEFLFMAERHGDIGGLMPA